jgi:hypothetical protein
MGRDHEGVERLLGQDREDDDAFDNTTRRISIFRSWKVIKITVFVICGLILAQIVALFALAIAIKALQPSTMGSAVPIPSEQQHSHCGNSTAEALARNCHFDVFSFGWHPPNCWDEELYNDFLDRHRGVLYWETTDGTPVSVEEVMRGEHSFLITTWEFHLVHCLYAWEKTTRAVLMKKPLDEWSPKYGHAKHCVHELMHQDRYGMKEMMTSSKRWYPLCGLSDRNMATLLGH